MSAGPGDRLNLRSLLRGAVATWPRRSAIAVVVLVPTVVAALGGFATVPPAPPNQIPPGVEVHLGPYSARFESFFVSDRVWASSLPADAEAWVGVVAELTAPGPDDVSLRSATILPTSAPGLLAEAPERAIIMRDDSLLFWLLPDITERVAILWPVEDAEAVGDSLTVELYRMYQEESIISGDPTWYEESSLGSVTLPRDDALPPVMVDEESET